MMKSWADHCSSDEDTDDNFSVGDEEQQSDDDACEETSIEDDFSDKVRLQEQQQERTYDFPDRPPFTAFIGNLSYDIQEADQLQKALVDVVFRHLGERITPLGGHISYDRDNNRQHRGFGYVELNTLEEVRDGNRCNAATCGVLLPHSMF